MRTLRWLSAALARRVRATSRVWRRGGAYMALLNEAAATMPTPPEIPIHPLPGGSIDVPAAGTTVARSVIEVRGWAMTAAGPCSRVELTVDAQPVGRARLGDLRPDVEAVTQHPAGALSGFYHTIDLTELPRPRTDVELGGFGVGLNEEAFPLPPLRVSVAARTRELAEPSSDLRPGRTVRRQLHRGGRSGELRLLVVTHELGYGGAQLFLTELLRRLSDIGPLSGVVLSPSEGPTRGTLEDIGFDVHVTMPFPIDSLNAYDSRLEELAGWARDQGFDAALVNTMVAFPGADVAARSGLPTVWAIHESYPLPRYWAAYGDTIDPGVRQRAEAALAGVATAAFTCEATRACYEPYLSSLRCATLPYGIDVDALDRWRDGFDVAAAREAEGIDDETMVILCLGTIEPRKSQTQLIHAFAQLADRHPQSRLLLVGSRGDQYAEAAETAVRVHGLEDRVRIQPVLADVRPTYAISDLMVSASDVESTPRSILEAMALRLPVLATEVFGVPELIADGQSGWLCEPRDVTALASALDRVLSMDADKRVLVTEKARQVVDTQYRSEICSREWDRTLREAAANALVDSPAQAGKAGHT